MTKKKKEWKFKLGESQQVYGTMTATGVPCVFFEDVKGRVEVFPLGDCDDDDKAELEANLNEPIEQEAGVMTIHGGFHFGRHSKEAISYPNTVAFIENRPTRPTLN